MTTPTTAELLKYADLQMAAKAFLVNENDSCLRSIYIGYSHKTPRNTDCKVLGIAQAQGKRVCVAELGAGSGEDVSQPIYDDASSCTNKKLVIANGAGTATRHYKNRSRSRRCLKG
jgi:hypothetical protein